MLDDRDLFHLRKYAQQAVDAFALMTHADHTLLSDPDHLHALHLYQQLEDVIRELQQHWTKTNRTRPALVTRWCENLASPESQTHP